MENYPLRFWADKRIGTVNLSREWSGRTKREPVGPLVAIEHTSRCSFNGDKSVGIPFHIPLVH